MEKVFEKSRLQETALNIINQQNMALQLNVQNLFAVVTTQNTLTVDFIATVKQQRDQLQQQTIKVQRLELLLVDISNEVMRYAPCARVPRSSSSCMY